MLYRNPRFRFMGDCSLMVEWGDEISPEVNRRVREFAITVGGSPPEGLLEIIPAYRSLLLIFDPLKIHLQDLKTELEDLSHRIGSLPIPEPRTLEVPVVYGGVYGPDLEWVADYHRLSSEEVVRLHTESSYHVYMIGFTPGFPYLGELPGRLSTPRRQTPRTAVPAGSVGIAQKQTGIYPVESPGGWQIIGRTPLKLFHPHRVPPVVLDINDRIRFFAIQEEEFAAWQ